MSRNCTLDPLKDRVLRHGSHRPRDFLALSDENETGNALNTETGGQRRLRLRVQLAKTQLRFDLHGGGQKAWRHLPARPAPLRPEVDQQRNIARGGMSFKVCSIERYRPAEE